MKGIKSIWTVTVLIAVPFAHSLSAEEKLTVVSWGGSYAQACDEAIFQPFEEATGIKINLEDYNGGLAQIRAQVDSGNIHWDVVDVESQDDLIGCDEGLLEFLDDLELPPAPDGTPAEEDFLAGANSDCGLGTIVWATIIAYNTTVFEEDPPTTLEDFFDLEKYPGKRGLRRLAVGNLEFALMADGVPADKVYELLATEKGVSRAFDMLDTLKDQDSVVFWEAGAQPPQLLADKEVVLSTAYNGRIFNAQNLEDQPFKIIWDAHLRDYGQLSIVAGTPNLDNAMKLLEFAARSSSIAGISNRISYGPLRHSAWEMVGKHLVTGVDMRSHMPTAPSNSKKYLVNDPKFWAEYKDELTERFSAWLSRSIRRE